MKQLNIAQFVLLAGAGIGLLLLVFTGDRSSPQQTIAEHPSHVNELIVENNNNEVIRPETTTLSITEPQTEEPVEQPSLPVIVEKRTTPQKPIEQKPIEVVEKPVSVVTDKTPQPAHDEDAWIGIWESSSPENPTERLTIEKEPIKKSEKTSPFFVAKETKTKNITFSQTNNAWDEEATLDLEEESETADWHSLSADISPRKQSVSPLHYSGKPTETEYQLDTIRQQLGQLANKSKLQYQYQIRKSAKQVRSLQREIRIDSLENQLKKLKWAQTAPHPKSPHLAKRYVGQRYYYIARQPPKEKPVPQAVAFEQPKQVEAKSPISKTAQKWERRKKH